MDRSLYVEKMNTILLDPTKFKKDERQVDDTKKTTAAISVLLKKLVSLNILTSAEYRRLSPTGAVIPRMYGLPKLHKDGVPLRPILSMTKSATEPVSRWLTEMLQPVQERFTARCVKDSFTFVNKLRSMQTLSRFMVSYDVSSLFTNVPVLDTIEKIVETVENSPHLCPIPPPVLRDLLTVCTTNVQFLFNDIFYKQVDGVAMGSSLGCLFANVFMGHLEEKVDRHINDHCSFYVRYIDDTFALVRDENTALKLLSVLNNAHACLTFTHESEQNDTLPFLDVKVMKNSLGTFSTSVHRKATFSGIYLNFNSYVPVSYKKGLVRTLFTRANRICSPEFLQSEISFLTDSLKRNSYPEYFIKRHGAVKEGSEKPPTVNLKPVYLRVPFYGDRPVSRLRERLNAAVRRVFPAAGPVLLFNTTRIPVASPKDRLPGASTSSVIYSFRCGCGTANYIGRTSRPLATRSREHIPRWLERGLSGQCHSSITEHILACNCDRENLLSNFSILVHARNELLLKILEALFIRRDRPNLCRQKDFVTELCLPW
jgi:hypothetical protein